MRVEKPLHQLRWSPSPKGEAFIQAPSLILGSPLGELASRRLD